MRFKLLVTQIVLTDGAGFEIKVPGVEGQGFGLDAFANPGKGYEILKRSDEGIFAAFGFAFAGGFGFSDGFFFSGLGNLHPAGNKPAAYGV